MPTKFDRLQSLLAELFQLDQADPDFGLYRIMNLRREEITRFPGTDLAGRADATCSVCRHQPGRPGVVDAPR